MELHPNVLLYILKREWAFFSLGILLVLAGIATPFMGAPFEFSLVSGAIGVFLLVFTAGYSHLYCQTTRLYLSGEEIVYDSGILNKISRRIPLHIFSETVIQRTFFDTLLGSGTLRVYGRPGSHADISVSEVKLADIKAMQEEILGLVHELPPSLPDQYDVADPSKPPKPAAPAPAKK